MVSSVDCSFKAVEVSVVDGLDHRIGRSKSHSGVFMSINCDCVEFDYSFQGISLWIKNMIAICSFGSFQLW